MKSFFYVLLICLFLGFIGDTWAQTESSATSSPSTSSGKKNVSIKYREKEKFDLDDLSIEGDGASPGDLTIDQRYENKFKNELPHRYNFNPEIRNAVEAIR